MFLKLANYSPVCFSINISSTQRSESWGSRAGRVALVQWQFAVLQETSCITVFRMRVVLGISLEGLK